MAQTDTKWGVPVVYKNELANTFEICRFGDVGAVLATGLKSIDEAGAWARARGGFLGLTKEHMFIGRYREVVLPERSCYGHSA
jgi:hypothetical protein